MIKTVGLTKSFGKNMAVSDVSLHVLKQDIFGLVGPDGAGKTTLLRMICGLITPDRGEVIFQDPPGETNGAVPQLGYMPQRFSLYGDLTVMENINFFGAMYGLDKKIICARADEILELTGLLEFKKRFADNLSGGMKQKLALTCALVARPGILVLDEPTYGVDPESRKEFWKILYRLNQEGMTVLVSTPYMDEAELCKMVAFIDRGKIAAVDSPVNIKRNFKYRVLEVRVGLRDPEIFRDNPGVLEAFCHGDKYKLLVNDISAARRAIEQQLSGKGMVNYSIRETAPSMEDVFVSLVEKEVV